jgi:DNA polymerase-3 subunit delta'
MRQAQPWPPALAGTPAVAVIEQAIEKRRLSHSLLLHCDDSILLEAIAASVADRLLNTADAAACFPVERHPDCFTVRPIGKMRLIKADQIRELISRVQVSPGVAVRKVAILYEVDRMNPAASNIFLKTLEEPPSNTMLLLLTSRPYDLLPTIRSRVLHFRFPSEAKPVPAEGWNQWISDYNDWLARLSAGVSTKRDVADQIFSVYGLVARFGLILDTAVDLEWQKQKPSLPEEITDEEQDAIETGLANGIRARLFADIERATRNFAVPRIIAGETATRAALGSAVDKLEHDVSLLRLNINILVALEDFLLASLRTWSRR